MPSTTTECPLCGMPAEAFAPSIPGPAIGAGVTAVTCSGPCGAYKIETPLIGKVPPGIAAALSRQAAKKALEGPDYELEITRLLLTTLGSE